MSHLLPRARAAQARAAKRWHVYLILCGSGAVYTGIARNVTVRYAQHVAGTGARYTRANPPRRLLIKFACLNQSEPCGMEAAIKKLTAINKRKLVGKTGTEVRKILLRRSTVEHALGVHDRMSAIERVYLTDRQAVRG